MFLSALVSCMKDGDNDDDDNDDDDNDENNDGKEQRVGVGIGALHIKNVTKFVEKRSEFLKPS